MYTEVIKYIEQMSVKHRQIVINHTRDFTPMLKQASSVQRCLLLKLLLDVSLRDCQYLGQSIEEELTLEEAWNKLQMSK
jgi:hypothetical protein